MSRRSKGALVEQAVLALLISQLKKCGWRVTRIHDGDYWRTVNPLAVEARVFNLDDCHLQFNKGKRAHWVKLVLGNGTDIISDWGYHDGDADKFNACMQSISGLIDNCPLRFVVPSQIHKMVGYGKRPK